MTHTVSVIGASVYQNCASDEKKSRQKVFDKISEVFAELGRDQDADFGFIVDDLGHLRSIRHFWDELEITLDRLKCLTRCDKEKLNQRITLQGLNLFVMTRIVE